MQKKLIDKRLLTLYDKNIKYTGSILNKNTTYKENDIIFFEGAILKVTVAGTTDSTLKAVRTFLATAKTGDAIVSGTATLKLMSLTDDIVIEDWKTKTNYIVNNVVMNDNKLYRCTKAHTSTTDIYADIANWEYIAPFHDWKTSTQYVLNDIVINDKKIYRCTTAHTSTNTFDETKWEEISALENTVKPWATEIDYKANDLIYIDNVLYKCNTAHTSTAFSADVSKWDNMYSNIIDFNPTMFYKKGSYVLYNNNIYKALKDTTGDIGDNFQLKRVSFRDTKNIYTKIIGTDSRGIKLFTEPNGNYINNVIDLGNIYGVTKITISNFAQGYCEPGETTIETSTDGESYTEASSFTTGGYGNFKENTTLNINKKARYIKIVFKSVYKGNNGTGDNFVFNDVRIYTANIDWQKITNTQKPSIETWRTGTDYKKNEIVVYNEKIYRCTIKHTSGTLFDNVEKANWEELSPTINEITDWKSNTSYNAKDIVINDNALYRCKTAHTSTSSFATDALTYWDKLSGANSVDVWASGKSYDVGQLVVYNNQLFRANVSHASSVTFDLDGTKWNLLESNIGEYKANVYYPIGTSVIYNNALFKCKVAHNSTSTFNMDNWTRIDNNNQLVKDWEVSTAYTLGQFVTHNNILYKCNTAHTSDSTSFDTDIAKWDKIGSSIDQWKANTPYRINDLVIYTNKLYSCDINHTSANAIDLSKWTLIGDEGIKDWASGTTYEVGSMVIISNANNISEWTTNTSYNANNEVIYNGYIYMCKTANTDATFTESNWTIKEPVYNRMYRCIKENKDTTFTEANWQLINGDSVAKESDVEDLLL